MTEILEIPLEADYSAAHVLVVDDEDAILSMVSLCLEQQGHQVTTAKNAEQARQLVTKQDFDVIVTDVMMPGEDGISFLAAIHLQWPDVPVIVMTGYAHLDVAIDAIKNGAFYFINKPFDVAYFNKLVERAVDFIKLRRMEKRYHAQLEETVAHRTDDLKNALSQLEETRALLLRAASDKNDFLSTITHEMRTPMNGVIGALDLLADSGLAGVQLEYAQLARQAAGNMVELVDSVLAFADGVGHGPAICYNIFDLSAFIDELALAYSPKFTAKKLSFETCVAQEAPRRISCDREQLRRLLDILLGNALKFTGRGGVTLDFSLERRDEQRAVIHITVADTGVGIPAEMLERIFEPFIQVEATLTRRFGGAGLGLSIAGQIAQLFNGRIWAESVLGDGSRFHVLITVKTKTAPMLRQAG